MTAKHEVIEMQEDRRLVRDEKGIFYVEYLDNGMVCYIGNNELLAKSRFRMRRKQR